MTPFFNRPDRVADLREVALTWLGTPFVESSGAKARPGVCADCCWVAMPLQRLGAIGEVPWPRRYVSRGGGPQMLEILLGVLDGTERLFQIWKRSAGESEVVPRTLAGDVLVFSTGTRLHHLGLVLDHGTLAHSWNGQIQLASSLDHMDLIYAIYRPLEDA